MFVANSFSGIASSPLESNQIGPAEWPTVLLLVILQLAADIPSELEVILSHEFWIGWRSRVGPPYPRIPACQAEGQEQAVDAHQQPRKVLVLARQRGVLDALAGSLDVAQVTQRSVERGQAKCVEPPVVIEPAQDAPLDGSIAIGTLRWLRRYSMSCGSSC
jgi:hypothetical protein